MLLLSLWFSSSLNVPPNISDCSFFPSMSSVFEYVRAEWESLWPVFWHNLFLVTCFEKKCDAWCLKPMECKMTSYAFTPKANSFTCTFHVTWKNTLLNVTVFKEISMTMFTPFYKIVNCRKEFRSSVMNFVGHIQIFFDIIENA